MASAKLIVAPSKASVGSALSFQIVQACQEAVTTRGAFTLALSGGSLPSFLQKLSSAFSERGIDPQWSKWHVLLADERCVVSTDSDSNLGAIRTSFTSTVPIPVDQIYGIDEVLLSKSTQAVALSYEENVVKPLLEKSGGKLDCVLLGFGPDGHTCSLFPGSPLLLEQTRLVAPIDDSPKPPPSRITFTLPLLNNMSRKIIFCGAGSSKSPILKAVFETELKCLDEDVGEAKIYDAQLTDPAPYPCGMVRPESLIWVVDADAANEIV